MRRCCSSAASARFPVAPWMIAAVLKLPVSLAFGLYRGGNRYDLVFETFEDQGLDLPRAQRATRMAAPIQRYAARLEHHARQAPYQWFDFYNFWNAHDKPQPPTEGAAHTPGTTGSAR